MKRDPHTIYSKWESNQSVDMQHEINSCTSSQNDCNEHFIVDRLLTSSKECT